MVSSRYAANESHHKGRIMPRDSRLRINAANRFITSGARIMSRALFSARRDGTAAGPGVSGCVTDFAMVVPCAGNTSPASGPKSFRVAQSSRL